MLMKFLPKEVYKTHFQYLALKQQKEYPKTNVAPIYQQVEVQATPTQKQLQNNGELKGFTQERVQEKINMVQLMNIFWHNFVKFQIMIFEFLSLYKRYNFILLLLFIIFIKSVTKSQMASNYPLLPGFAPTQQFKEHYKKVSAQKQEANRDILNIQPTKYLLPRENQYVQSTSKPLTSTTHDHFNPKNAPQTSKLFQPDWVRLDRHVLRFYGYFKESVVERNGQNQRNRKVKILIYLQDNSISINEQKQQNSGVPQGKFLKRQKCLGPDGKFLTAYDFKVGQSILLYGRYIFLYNCDQYTRQFYEKNNIPQGPALPYEDDQWTAKTNAKWIPQKDAQMKDYLEKKLGGGRIVSQKQFLQNDRKVLKFFCTYGGERYIIHFFLADDTIQVREVSIPNSGKDPFPVTFRRQKLPKKFALNQPGQTYAEQFLTAAQLEVGRPVHIFGRDYLIEGCDAFTRQYYLTKFGKQFPNYSTQSNVEQRNPKDNIIIPPHNGIGSQEDSLGYIYRLVPKPPKKDFFKWVDQQISLRFTAVFSNPKPQDLNRKLIITYYLNDDSIQIYEPPTKNSGFSEGKFLQRNQYKNEQGQNLLPCDLVIGYDVKINGYWFHLTDCDLFTKKWFAQNTIWERVDR